MSLTGSRQLRVENLEQRQMMAGDVAVGVVNGDLMVTGDSQDNSISVYQISNGDWVVSGNSSDGSLTKINGVVAKIGGHDYSFGVFSGVTDDVDIDLNGGDDNVQMYGQYGGQPAVVPDDLRIKMDSGHDKVILHDLHVADDTYIRTGSGNDLVYVRDSVFGFLGDDGGNNDLDIRTSTGSDKVELYDLAIQDDLKLYGENYSTLSNVDIGDDFYT